MNKNPVDKSKKSNIKCEHCLFREKADNPCNLDWCSLWEKEVHYYNRCKEFKWDTKYK